MTQIGLALLACTPSRFITPNIVMHSHQWRGKLINKRRNLREGLTLWEAKTPQSLRSRKAPQKRFYDVIIIGAGITGALVAETLSNQKLDVLVIDRRAPATGSTAASTALIQWEIDEPLRSLSRKIGKNRAQTAYKASFKAVADLRKKIHSLKLNVEMVARDTLLLAGDEMGLRDLRKEERLRRSIGLPSRVLDAEQLKERFGFEREGGICSKGSIELNPRKLALELLARAMKNGVELVSPATVTAVEGTAAGVFVTLDDGTTIAASKVIAATGYETLPEIPKDRYDLVSTWALATVPQKADAFWPGRALVWEASDPYLYFRTSSDNRMVVGGEDEAFRDPKKRDALIRKKTKHILLKFKKLCPEARLVAEYSWSGTFAQSPTGLPVIGPVEKVPNLFAILGAGGNGITFSVIAADLAKAWVFGRKHKLAPIFAL